MRPSSLQEAVSQGCNLVIASDGGRRMTGEAAAGWVAYAAEAGRNATWRFEFVAQQGVYLRCVPSAFTAEAMAIEAAIQRICSMFIT